MTGCGIMVEGIKQWQLHRPQAKNVMRWDVVQNAKVEHGSLDVIGSPRLSARYALYQLFVTVSRSGFLYNDGD